MTHNDIYIKFMIEYDKAGASTSYPSLTEYEVATVLDKAYNALIAQKVTGNNYRRATFESDIKSIADLGPLVDTTMLTSTNDESSNIAPNVMKFDLKDQPLLYFLNGSMLWKGPTAIPYADAPAHTTEKEYTPYPTDKQKYNPVDDSLDDVDIELGETHESRGVPVKLVDHETAYKFFASASNIPWIKEPVCFMEGNNLFVVYDKLNPPTNKFRVTFIKKPNKFVKDLDNLDGAISYFDKGTYSGTAYDFECNETVAEELISLAVAFALENVESSRLNSKLNMRGLEA